jgi:hypothetical protein
VLFAQTVSIPICLPRPARRLRVSEAQHQPTSSEGGPQLLLQQQDGSATAAPGQQAPGKTCKQQQQQQSVDKPLAGFATAADAGEGVSCKPAVAAQGQAATACSSSSSSSEVLQELHRLRTTKFCQAAGPLMLSIVACLLVLALLPQLQQTLAGAGGSSAGSCSNGKCQLLVQALPGLAAVAVSQLRPLQFRAPALERGFQGCAAGSKRAIDVLFSSVWCLLVLCTSLRISWQTAAAAAGVVAEQAGGAIAPAAQRVSCWCLAGVCQLPSGPEACAAIWTLTVPPSVLLLVLPMAALLLLACRSSNSRHLILREPLHVVCRLVVISTGLGVTGQPASAWLLLLTLMHASTVACTMVRFLAFIPMQLMQTVALLLCTQGLSLLSGVQLIAAGLLVPCFVVLQSEAAARQAYLAAGLPCAELAACVPAAKWSWFGMWGGRRSTVPAATAAAKACSKGDAS